MIRVVTITFAMLLSLSLWAGSDLMVKGVRFFYPTKDSAQVFTLHQADQFVSMRENSEQDMFLHFSVGIEVKSDEGKLIYETTQNHRSTFIEKNKIPMTIKFPLSEGKYSVGVIINDINSSKSQRFNYSLERKTGFNPENILPIDVSNGEIIYFNYTYTDSIELFAPLHKNEELNLMKFATSDFISPPPFNKSTGKMNFDQPESTGGLLFNIEGKAYVTSYEDGVYVISRSQTLLPSFLMLHFAIDFPKIEHVKSITPPMRYITSTTEYNSILDAKTTLKSRAAFEKFWLTCAKGSKSKARGLIKEYFNRVEFTNQFYTSYKEGWKTDKGMIYIVFGPPDFKEEKDGIQTWIYGNKSRINSLVFYFEQVEGSISPNDYILERRPDYKTPWYIAIESWRSGKSYNYR